MQLNVGDIGHWQQGVPPGVQLPLTQFLLPLKSSALFAALATKSATAVAPSREGGTLFQAALALAMKVVRRAREQVMNFIFR
jgi:hypothetical protein